MPQSPEKRRKQVFRAVVREYVDSAEPVGSETILAKYAFGVSSATLRHDLADLVEQGLLVQPHTSAGRVPTESGYRSYVEQFVREAVLAERQRQAIVAAMSAFEAQRETAARSFARMVAEMTGDAVVLRLNPEETLFSGLSNLAAKPESQLTPLMLELSRALDEIEATMEEVRRRLSQDVAVFIGHDNPFGQEFAGVFTELAVPGVGATTIGVVGPKRMDYDRNVALLRFLKESGGEDNE
ncbi:MAG: DeoR family transcriptional regulator [Patescibacteria group bacterium]|nr:DeoR family transcriptional regulator [Patescibacteria group bacterium]